MLSDGQGIAGVPLNSCPGLLELTHFRPPRWLPDRELGRTFPITSLEFPGKNSLPFPAPGGLLPRPDPSCSRLLGSSGQQEKLGRELQDFKCPLATCCLCLFYSDNLEIWDNLCIPWTRTDSRVFSVIPRMKELMQILELFIQKPLLPFHRTSEKPWNNEIPLRSDLPALS